jgi:hypothetical protein
MRTSLQLAAALALLSTAATCAHAQIEDPNHLIAQPPRNPAHHYDQAPLNDLQWMWKYAKPAPSGDPTALRYDARFKALLESTFKQPQAMWNSDITQPPALAQVIPLFLTANGEVTSDANRFISIDGCVPDFCPAHGMLWADLGLKTPLIVFAGVTWSAQNHTTDSAAADYTLWLFASRDLSADSLPLALRNAISHWDARLAMNHRLVPHINRAVLVAPDGSAQPVDPANAGANTLPPQPPDGSSTS